MDELIEERIKEAEGQLGIWVEQAQYAGEKVAEWRGALAALRGLRQGGKGAGGQGREAVDGVDGVGQEVSG